MLVRVTGSVGCGKTRRIESMIAQDLKKSNPILYLVPEQHTVTAERSVLSLSGAPTQNLEILNFSRLPNFVFRNEGGIALPSVDKAGKRLILASVLEELSPSLTFYRSASLKTDFMEMLQNLNEEFLQKNIQPQTLLSLGETVGKGAFSEKISDLATILAAYTNRLRETAEDTAGEMYRLSELLKTLPYFEEYIVYLDGFYGFSAPEYALLRHLLRQAKKVVITFEMPSDIDPADPGAFSSVLSTHTKITRMAKEEGIETEDIFPDYDAPMDPALRFLSDRVTSPAAFGEKTKAVQIFSAKDRYAEVKEVARRICRLVRSGVRYRDIRVFMRNPSDYRGIIEPLFAYYAIPCSLQHRHSPLTHPLSAFLFSSLEMIFHTPTLYTFQNLLKSGYTSIDATRSFEIESYAMTWNIRGNAYFSPFVMHPRGYRDTFEEEDEALLAAVNESREILMTPIDLCRKAIKDKTVKETATAFWQYIEDTGVFDRLSREAELYKEKGDFASAGELLTLWNAWLSALDQMVLVLGDTVIGDRFADYLRLALSALDFGRLPASIDEVEVGEIGFIRSEHPDHLFLLGVNEGIFPAIPAHGGIFTPNERAKLTLAGLDMEQGEFEGEDEWFKFYCAVSAPQKTLTISYSNTTDGASRADDSTAAPSVFVDRVCAVFPDLTIASASDNTDPVIPAEIVSRILDPQVSEEEKNSIRALVEEVGDASLKASLKNTLLHTKTASARTLTQNTQKTTLSLTQARYDSYTKCPFSYYAKYLLSATEEKGSQFTLTDVGNYLHRILELFMTEVAASDKKFTDLTRNEITDILKTLVESYLDSLHIGERLSARFRYLVSRLQKSLLQLILQLQEEFTEGLFAPVRFELNIGDAQPPYTVTLKDGTAVKFYGKIDRVDLYTSASGEHFIRIADYKSSVKKLSMQDIYNGFNIQLLIYLFALWDSGMRSVDTTLPVSPAGVMYIPTVRESIQTQKALSPEEEILASDKKDTRDGLFLQDEDVLKAMEPSLAGKFIPVTLNKEGALDSKKLIAAATFGKLKKHIEKTVCKIADEIRGGNIEANPNLSADACKYCPYLPMCRNTEQKGRKYGYIGKDADILKRLEDENDG